VDNINSKPLTEILNSEFFHAIRRRRPYSPNYYRPCLIIDHPHILRQVVGEGQAHPTHRGAESILNDFSAELDRYAEVYGKLADDLWQEEHRAAAS